MDNDNRKIKLTKKMLKDSLIELLKIKPISKISIKELCINADINRSTFYAYYSSQYDLLEHIENKIILKLDVVYSNLNFSLSQEQFYDILCIYFEFINTEIDFFKIMYGENGDMHFVEKATAVAESKMFANAPKHDSMEHLMYIYITNGINGIIKEWIYQEHPMPPKKLAKIAAQIVNHTAKLD